MYISSSHTYKAYCMPDSLLGTLYMSTNFSNNPV